MQKRFNSKFRDGFTLIEMMVSLAIFSVVAVIALGSLIRIMSANQKAQSLHDSMTNISFALESMSRELREGIEMSSIATDINGNNKIIFRSRRAITSGAGDSRKIDCYLMSSYYLEPDPNNSQRYYLKKAEAQSCTPDPVFSTADYIDMISPSVTLTSESKLILIQRTGDKHAYITIRLVGSVGSKEKVKTYFDVQTGISQRFGAE